MLTHVLLGRDASRLGQYLVSLSTLRAMLSFASGLFNGGASLGEQGSSVAAEVAVTRLGK